mgnify:CR=1 FL=1
MCDDLVDDAIIPSVQVNDRERFAFSKTRPFPIETNIALLRSQQKVDLDGANCSECSVLIRVIFSDRTKF